MSLGEASLGEASLGAAAIRAKRAAAPWRVLVLALFALAGLALLAERLQLALARPLWLDETWTAAIVSPPSWAGFWREAWLDVNAPLYYLAMRGWTALFGLGDLTLRLPGLILAPLAALLAWRAPGAALPAASRWMWAGLVFFWWGCGQFLDGRCYALLFLLSVAQALVFVRLLRAPSLGAASLWAAISSLTILCHYYALFIVAAQGLIYLGRERGQAARTWPALAVFAPALAWMAYHAPRIAEYGRPDVAWHPALNAGDALGVAGFTLGAYCPYLSITVAAALAIVGGWAWSKKMLSPAGAGREAWWAAAAGLLALGLMLASAAAKPTLSPRYAIPIVPSILLGVTLCAQTLRWARILPAGLVAAYALFALDPIHFRGVLDQGAPSPYGFEAGEAFLGAQGVSDVTYLWDHPAAKIMDPGSLRRIGAVYFDQVGEVVTVRPIIAAQDQDPNRLLLAAARGPHPGVLWIYDRPGRTAAHDHPPRIDQLDPRWTCHTFGDGQIGSVACARRGG